MKKILVCVYNNLKSIILEVIKKNVQYCNPQCGKLIAEIADMSHCVAIISLLLDKHNPTCATSSNCQLYIIYIF